MASSAVAALAFAAACGGSTGDQPTQCSGSSEPNGILTSGEPVAHGDAGTGNVFDELGVNACEIPQPLIQDEIPAPWQTVEECKAFAPAELAPLEKPIPQATRDCYCTKCTDDMRRCDAMAGCRAAAACAVITGCGAQADPATACYMAPNTCQKEIDYYGNQSAAVWQSQTLGACGC